jgi:hypothetical protein
LVIQICQAVEAGESARSERFEGNGEVDRPDGCRYKGDNVGSISLSPANSSHLGLSFSADSGWDGCCVALPVPPKIPSRLPLLIFWNNYVVSGLRWYFA